MHDLTDDGNSRRPNRCAIYLSVLKGRDSHALLLRETVLNGCQRRVSLNPTREQRRHRIGQGTNAHQQHHGALGAQGRLNRRHFGFRQAGVTRNDGENRGHLTQGHRNRRTRRNRNGAGNAGDNLSLQACGDARIQLFSTATVHVRVATLQTHHGLTRKRVINHELLNAGLRNSVLTGNLAHINNEGVRRILAVLLRGEVIQKDHIRLTQGTCRTQGQQVSSTGAATHNVDLAGVLSRLTGQKDAAFRHAIVQGVPGRPAREHLVNSGELAGRERRNLRAHTTLPGPG